MSFLTCFCDFPQKEHFSRSPPSPIRATYVLLELAGRQLPAQDRGLIASLPSHRLPNRVTEAADSTLPAKGQFSDPPKRACQGSASLTLPRPAPDTTFLAARPDGLQALLAGRQDHVDEAVLLGLLRRHDLVAVDVLADLVGR